MSDPYKTMLETITDDVIMQELVTYTQHKDGTIHRTIVTRRFYNNDYVDSKTNLPLTITNNIVKNS